MGWASNPWPTRSQLLHSYSRKFSKFLKNRFPQKKKKKSYHEFWYMFKKKQILNFFFFFFFKIPMTNVSNMTWASNPWPTRSQLLFSYFTVTPENFLSFSKTDFTKKKKNYITNFGEIGF